jgi:hypothetical protein
VQIFIALRRATDEFEVLSGSDRVLLPNSKLRIPMVSDLTSSFSTLGRIVHDSLTLVQR